VSAPSQRGDGPRGPGRDGLVVVPVERPWHPGAGDPALRVEREPDGTLAGLAYSSPAALAAAWGEGQPWVAVALAELAGTLDRLGVARVLVDGRRAALPGLR
jgi:hypothetical protein